jgi:hypothetical protein
MTLSHTAKEQGVGVEGTQHRKRKFVPARWTEGNSLSLRWDRQMGCILGGQRRRGFGNSGQARGLTEGSFALCPQSSVWPAGCTRWSSASSRPVGS